MPCWCGTRRVQAENAGEVFWASHQVSQSKTLFFEWLKRYALYSSCSAPGYDMAGVCIKIGEWEVALCHKSMGDVQIPSHQVLGIVSSN